MSPVELATLAVLALIDSTSIGTLLLPLWFMLAPQGVARGRYLLYLGTIGGFYALVGLLLLLGGRVWIEDLRGVSETVVGARVIVAVGALLLVSSFFMGSKDDKPSRPGRLARWRDRAMSREAGAGGVVGLALLAGTLELAGMLPYLAAIGMLADSSLAFGGQAGLLLGYCTLMLAPALLLLALRLGLRHRIEPLLRRLATWLQGAGAETTAWVVGIVGFLLARSAWQNAELTGLLPT